MVKTVCRKIFCPDEQLIFLKQNRSKTQKILLYNTAIKRKEKEVPRQGENNMATSKLVKANEKIAEKAVGAYRKIEQTVVGGYKKIEDSVVGGYEKIENGFVDRYLTHDGESVEDAKKRLHAEQEARNNKQN